MRPEGIDLLDRSLFRSGFSPRGLHEAATRGSRVVAPGAQTLARDATRGYYKACHQELNMRSGIRFGEGFEFEELVDAGVDRFVLTHTPLRAGGATSASAPALAIAPAG